jgi:hypothetical protein
MGQSTQQIVKLKRTRYYSINNAFIGADVNATSFDLSLGHLQAYMKQQ